MGYADIHTHIIPDVDDGSDSMAMTLKMLEAEKKQGTSLVIFTPHYIHGKNAYTKESLAEKYREVCDLANAASLGLNLSLGNECYYSKALIDDLDKGLAATMGSSSRVLLEFSPGVPAKKLLDGCRSLYNSGYGTILAHMERYRELDGKVLESLLEMEVQLQMNASYARMLSQSAAFIGKKRWHRKLMKDGLISYIASDAHNNRERDVSLHADIIRKAVPEYADAMLGGNAERLIHG